MKEMHSFTDVHAYLNGLMSETRSRRHAYTLERIQQLMEYLGNPQDSYKVIHVAGTSGKTSTCYYLSALLHQSGAKVGLTISPHLDEINERVQINNRPISEKQFCRSFENFIAKVEKSGITLTYFEIVVAFAYWEFARRKVDYAVIEVGLGGLLDGTNVINRSDKVCVITDIGYDHTSTLGKSLPAIAAQKAGIIKPHNPVFSYVQADEVVDVIQEVSAQQQAEFHEVLPLKPGELPRNLPLFQRRNWYLALKVSQFVSERDGLPEPKAEQLATTTLTYVPARMEVIQYKGKTLILDGAHNGQKLATLAASIKYAYPKQKVACMTSFIRTKQQRIIENLESLLPICSHLIITKFEVANTEKYSTDPLKIVEQAEAKGYEAWEVVDDPIKALDTLLKREEELLLITGSLYLLAEIRKHITM